MVVGEINAKNGSENVAPSPPVNTKDNIISGISGTSGVKMNNHKKKLRQRFDIIKKLGQGTYGKVQLGINKETGQEVAIKTIKKCKIETEADLIRIRREVQIMSSVQHPNIIHIYEVFENREKMVLVMEFAAGGELYDYLSERKVLSEDEARRVFRQISTAIYYCHKHKICHRDIKLENILLDENGNAKIADFGLSNVFDEHRLLSTFCGSPLYASPEIVNGNPYLGPEVDCWSLGVLLYTLVYGAMPFDGSNFKRLVKQISSGDYFEPKNSAPASPLIKEMLTVNTERRSNIEQICSHWWINQGYQNSCLDVAEELANATPVRLDVLLSLASSTVTPEQLVIPISEGNEKSANVPRSHSVGSIRDMNKTEAERRIIDMVATGGEAALAPSRTRILRDTDLNLNSVNSENMPNEKISKIDENYEKQFARVITDPVDVQNDMPMEITKSVETPKKVDNIERTSQNTEPQANAKTPINEDKRNIDDENNNQDRKLNRDSSRQIPTSFFSLQDARQSMENSIALLKQARTDSSLSEREMKLKNAREVIENAIPVKKVYPEIEKNPNDNIRGSVVASANDINSKSATLPRRKTSDMQKLVSPNVRYKTEIKIQPQISTTTIFPSQSVRNRYGTRGNFFMTPSNITNPTENMSYRQLPTRQMSSSQKDSDIVETNQQLNKSGREFIIPISMEGGGYVKRSGSLQPVDTPSRSTTTTTANEFPRDFPSSKLQKLMRIDPLFNDLESDSDETECDKSMQLNKFPGNDNKLFTLHQLRSSRPRRKFNQDLIDSASSGDEDDEDAFEILTAENLFSTLLSRVRALTNRLNISSAATPTGLSNPEYMSHLKHIHNPFWYSNSHRK